jgi:hypothetical protein
MICNVRSPNGHFFLLRSLIFPKLLVLRLAEWNEERFSDASAITKALLAVGHTASQQDQQRVKNGGFEIK